VPLDASKGSFEMNGKVAADEHSYTSFAMYEYVPSTTHQIAITDGELKAMYEIMYNKKKEVTHPLEGTYGEIDFEGVKKMINGIQENVLNLIDDQELNKFPVLDVGGGLVTTIIHFAQRLRGFTVGLRVAQCRVFAFHLCSRKS
jgi:hypothetical protein